MTPTEIEQIRARHQPEQLNNGEEVMAFCRFCKDKWPCDTSLLLAALSEAEAERDEANHVMASWEAQAQTDLELRREACAEVASLTAIRERAEQIANGPSEQEGLVALRILGAAPSPEPPPAPVVVDPRLMGERS